MGDGTCLPGALKAHVARAKVSCEKRQTHLGSAAQCHVPEGPLWSSRGLQGLRYPPPLSRSIAMGSIFPHVWKSPRRSQLLGHFV